MQKSDLPFGGEFPPSQIELAELLDLVEMSPDFALERLVFKLMGILDMRFVTMRLRAPAAGGFEIGCIFEATKPVFSRWQVQCRHTAHMTVDDVAKEVGLTRILKSHVIVMVSSGEIDAEARSFADQVMTGTNLSIVMIDYNDLATICSDPTHFADVLNREAHRTIALRRIEF